MELILVRHGLPDWAPDTFARNDPHLSELGNRQASRVAAVAERWGPIDEIWMSPMHRALETAAPIAESTGLAPVVHAWAHEIRNPDQWEGSPIDEIKNAWIDANLRPISDLWDGMPGGETFRDFHQRVVTGLEAALAQLGITRLDDGHPHLWNVADNEKRPDDKRVVLVAHGGTNAVVIGHLLGAEPTPWEWDRFESPHTGVARLSTLSIAHGRAFSLRVFGDVSHLDPEMVTK
ncbi:MAG TPA: histidine phosphatase family protein [Acidimicrobiia bacterium]|nr:histidine phosphatase family protein [Acidimicrobiia bacterium]